MSISSTYEEQFQNCEFVPLYVCNFFCFWSYILHWFLELLRSLPFSLTPFCEVVSYICNIVRFFWSDGSLKENGKMKAQSSENWVRKSLWTVNFLTCIQCLVTLCTRWQDSCTLFSLHLLWFLPICCGLNVCVPRNANVEVLTLSVMAFGEGPLGGH